MAAPLESWFDFDGEPFRGRDRLDQVGKRLATGGF
jgi:hypothetical protein